jgi:quinone-modifying oxidoreductase subunit QmoC
MAVHALPRSGRVDPAFGAEVRAVAAHDTRLDRCIQCGTCSGSCPSAADMDHSPRAIFALVRAGLRDEALASNTPWMCVSCYTCTVRCPQDVHIPDVMYALKAIASRQRKPPNPVATSFSQTFVGNIRRYGRSYEIGLVTRHYLHYYLRRLPAMAPMGVAMVTSGRMGLMPHRIHDVAGLRAILARAEELDGAAVAAVAKQRDAAAVANHAPPPAGTPKAAVHAAAGG